MKTICFVGSDFFKIGGVSRVTTVLANRLVNEYKVIFIDLSGDVENRAIYNLSDRVDVISKELENSFRIKHFFWYRVFNKLRVWLPIWNLKFLGKPYANMYFSKNMQDEIIHIIENQSVDVVIGVQGKCSLLVATLAPRVRAHCVGWEHNSFDAYFKLKNYYCWHQDGMFKAQLPNLYKNVLLTGFDAEKTNSYFKTNNAICIHNPRSFESNKKSNVDNHTFVFVGRFDIEHKGLDFLLESFKYFKEYDSDWNLQIVGDGSEKESVRAMIDELELNDRVTVCPYSDDIIKTLGMSSIMLLASRWEGQPMVVLESLEMGVPIIAYEINAMKEIITDGKEGFLVKCFDRREFARKMYELSDNELLRKQMSINAIKRAKDFSLENIVDEWKKIIEK